MIFYDDGRYNEQHIMNEAIRIPSYYVSNQDGLSASDISKIGYWKPPMVDITKPKNAIYKYCINNDDIANHILFADPYFELMEYSKNDKKYFENIIYLYKCTTGFGNKVIDAEMIDSGKLATLGIKYGFNFIECKYNRREDNRLDAYKAMIKSLEKVINSSPYKSKVKFTDNNKSVFKLDGDSITSNLKEWLNSDVTLMNYIILADISELGLSVYTIENSKIRNLYIKAYQMMNVVDKLNYNIGVYANENNEIEYIIFQDITVNT